MKKILTTLIIFHFSLIASFAQKAHFTGKITGLKGSMTIIQVTDNGKEELPVDIAADGSFSADVDAARFGLAYLVTEEPKASTVLIVEPGMKADLQVSFGKKMSFGEETDCLNVVYNGDNKDAFEFENDYDMFVIMEKWGWDKLAQTLFADYRKAINDDIEADLVKLYQVKNANYRKMKGQQLEAERYSNLCRWAWGNRGKKDADFERWILSFDHNDTANMEKIGNYWRWYMESNMPPRKERTASSFYDCLKKAFTNQDIINMFAADWASQQMKDAPADMDEQLAAFKAVSTNAKDIAEVERLYNHYSKLKVGAPAANFTMQDRKGKTYSLKDLRGKAVYIDCWATWCGPCVAETPHMAKLYEHYKKDKRIQLVSISLDNNRKKWEKSLDQEKPGWLQFICADNFKSDLCKNYDIDGIPRFLMFDKKGRIVSLNAPRPSHEKIIEWIDSQL